MKPDDLPRDLGDGLVLRWAKASDADALAEFNFRMHNDSPGGVPEIWLKSWTHELMSGSHPTTGPADITMVVDESRGGGGQIVSTIVLISQTWSFEGLPFRCGRPELVATDDNYRRRGLVRFQFEAIHARSAAKGELVQAIAGIPWYYRQFGYEMALILGGGRSLDLEKLKPLPEGQVEPFQLRAATLEDLAFMKGLYQAQGYSSLITCLRNEQVWRYELEPRVANHVNRRNLHVIQERGERPVGYLEYNGFPKCDSIREFAVAPGISLRQAGLSVARALCFPEQEKSGQKSADMALTLRLGQEHAIYQALSEELGPPSKPYAWYLRVPDLEAFIAHIAPVLEQRLASSVMAGFDGPLKLNLYDDQLMLTFSSGLLTKVDRYEPGHFFDGDAFFPGRTFLQLLFGYRSVDELVYARADCFVSGGDAKILVNILFPKRHSNVVALA
ncbi:MAG: GNAT family N-acetyltransferase [Candidatus Promineifilaceae bacterium]